MGQAHTPLGLDRPATYEIQVEGRLDESWSDWFDGLEIAVKSQGDAHTWTTLTGAIADQAGLHGILVRIRDLGLPLISVVRIERMGDRKGGQRDTRDAAN